MGAEGLQKLRIDRQVLVLMRVGMRRPKMNVEFDPFDLAAFGPMRVEMVVVQGQLPQLLLDPVEIHTQVNHGPQEHIAAEAAENIKIKCVQRQFRL